jgi:hypothetical protein
VEARGYRDADRAVRGLDPSLFDAAVLAAKESGGRIPVQVRYHGTAVPHLPGVTVTAAGRAAATRTALGYLTATSARAFGMALARQYAADRPRDGYGTDGMFAGGVSVSLAGAAPAAQARPDLAMNTLTVTGTDLSGAPDTGTGPDDPHELQAAGGGTASPLTWVSLARPGRGSATAASLLPRQGSPGRQGARQAEP